ncbi:YncE family protein [Candidatus Eisenbacteria bacterium]|uniref:YncE family protein n=1 Tax=Eiseniibacteriota bacterium TaxID=2212470 RepID=A0ABV6YKP0_UNCEI
MNRRCLLTVMMLLVPIVSSLPATSMAKSLYAIADINEHPLTPINAYRLNGNWLILQSQLHVDDHGDGAVGLAVYEDWLDTTRSMLFVTFEGSNTVGMVDPLSMIYEGDVTASGASNLAGIVVDHNRDKVYTVDRATANLYVYDWNPVTRQLMLETSLQLTGVSTAYGIALDENMDLLYVSDLDYDVNVFNTSDWTPAMPATITFTSHVSTNVAIKESDYVYSGSLLSAEDKCLCRYNLATSAEDLAVDIKALTGQRDDTVLGLAVDQRTGYVYVSTGNAYGRLHCSDQIMVFDADLNLLSETGDIGNPTGICLPDSIGFEPTPPESLVTMQEGPYMNLTGQTAYDLTLILDGSQDVVDGILNDPFEHYTITRDSISGRVFVHWDGGSVPSFGLARACVTVRHPGPGRRFTLERVALPGIGAYWTDANGYFIGRCASFLGFRVARYDPVIHAVVAHDWRVWEGEGFPPEPGDGPGAPLGPVSGTDVRYAVSDVARPFEDLNDSLLVHPSLSWQSLDDFVLTHGESVTYELTLPVREDQFILFRYTATGEGLSAGKMIQVPMYLVPGALAHEVPTLSTLGLIVLVVALVFGAVLMLSRRRQAGWGKVR